LPVRVSAGALNSSARSSSDPDGGFERDAGEREQVDAAALANVQTG
jgi:hypothetical protein